MELVYLKFRNWKNFNSEVELNFNSNYLFKHEDTILYHKYLDVLPDSFFGERISNITQIVGGNGVGKTSLLELISSFVGTPFVDHIAIFLIEKNNFKVYRNGYDFALNDMYQTLTERIDIQTCLLNTTFTLSEYQNFDNFINLTNNSIYYELNNTSKPKDQSNLMHFQLKEFQKQIEYIKSACEFPEKNRLKNIKFFLPIENLNNGDYATYLSKSRRFCEKFIAIRHIIENINENRSIDKDQLKGLLIFYLFFIYAFPKDINTSEFSINLSGIDDFIGDLIVDSEILFSDSEKYKNWEKLCDFIIDEIENEHIKIDESFVFIERDIIRLYQNLVINISLNTFTKILESIKELPEISESINYTWNLSAGENAILSQFSRLYFAFDKKIDKRKPTLICADECDALLHPEWSRKLVYYYTKYLPSILGTTQYRSKIQLIFSSHSPFMISDMPSGNVISLEKNKTIKLSFGANINEILAEDFFLENGLMGEFAKEKILDVIKYLDLEHSKKINTKKLDALLMPEFSWTKESAMQIIQLIGEPIIKNNLLEFWKEIFNS